MCTFFNIHKIVNITKARETTLLNILINMTLANLA